MNTNKRPTHPSTAPLGVIDTLSAGVALVARHPSLLLLPILLDLWLWLGPPLHLSPDLVGALTAPFDLQRYSGGELPPDLSADLPIAYEAMQAQLGGANLWHLLILPLLFFPSVMAGAPTELTGFQIQGAGDLLVTLALLLGGGLVLNMLWLQAVARSTRGEQPWGWPARLLSQAGKHSLRFVGLILLLLMALIGLLLPLSLLVAFLTVIVPAVGQGLASLLAVGTTWLILWMGLYMYFAPGALVLDDAPILKALGNSVRLVRAMFWGAFGFVLLSIVLSVGFQLIWFQLGAASPVGRVVSIVGNAALGTTIAAAMFVFYRERVRLIDTGPPAEAAP